MENPISTASPTPTVLQPSRDGPPAGPVLVHVKAPSYSGMVRGERSGSGTIEVRDGTLALDLRQAGALWGGRTVVRVPADRVVNVERVGGDLAFEWDVGTKRRPRVKLRFADPRDAARVAALLPAATTADFAPAMAERAGFDVALRVAAPRLVVTPALVAANVAAFAAMVYFGTADVLLPDRNVVLAWGGNHWSLTTGGQPWRLLTGTILHFGVVHLALNMLALCAVGPLAERLYGRRFFAALYLAGGAFGSLASVWHNPPAVVGAGASGAVLAAYGLLLAYPLAQRRSVPRSVFRSLLRGTAAVVGNTLLFGLTQPFIDNVAHVGGLAAGFVLGLVCARPLAAERRAGQFGPRAWAAGAIVAAAGVAMWAGVPKCDLAAERAFLAERQAVGSIDATVSRTIDRLADAVQSPDGDPADVARRLREQVAPLLDEVDARLARSPPPADSPSRRLWEAWTRYAEAQRAAATAVSRVAAADPGTLTRAGATRALIEVQARSRSAGRAVSAAARAAWGE